MSYESAIRHIEMPVRPKLLEILLAGSGAGFSHRFSRDRPTPQRILVCEWAAVLTRKRENTLLQNLHF